MADLDEAEVTKGLEKTILLGWPHDTVPDDVEAVAIESTYNELSLHEPAMDDSRRWYLAGQIVARVRRDLPDYFDYVPR